MQQYLYGLLVAITPVLLGNSAPSAMGELIIVFGGLVLVIGIFVVIFWGLRGK